MTLWREVVITVAPGVGGENYQTPGREIGEVPEGPGYTHQTQQSVFLLLLLLHLCISLNMPAEGWGWGVSTVTNSRLKSDTPT